MEPGAGVLGLPPVESCAGWDGIPASGGVAAPRGKKGEETAAPVTGRSFPGTHACGLWRAGGRSVSEKGTAVFLFVKIFLD